MAEYATSTQKASWLLSEDALRARREEAHAAAASAIGLHNDATPMTLDNEMELLDHHQRRIAALSRYLKLPEKVSSSAVTYLKRFFVDRSVMEHNPSVVALHALYAASKVEETSLSAEYLADRADSYLNGRGGTKASKLFVGPSADRTAARVRFETLLNGELDFLQALHFQLVVYHPYRSLRVAIAHTASVLADDADRVRQRAEHLCATRVIFADLVFTRAPAAIAAAATLAATREIVPGAADGVLGRLAGDEDTRRNRLEALADQVAGLPKSSSTVARLTELEAMRLDLRDEVEDPATEMYRKREEIQEEEVDKERRTKLKRKLDREKEEATRFLMEAGSPHSGKRTRAEAGLDSRDENEHSPVRKRLNLMA